MPGPSTGRGPPPPPAPPRAPRLQSEGGAAKETACASRRSCASAFPTAEAHGLLWVWLEAGPGGEARAAATPLPRVPEVDPSGAAWFRVSPW